MDMESNPEKRNGSIHSKDIEAQVHTATRTEWNEVESGGFFTTGMTTQQTAPWENWHLEQGFKFLRTFGLVRWVLEEAAM
ncbi:hypothetical protein TNCT_406821 [Trichonephila clavata]|uniref:Uncharacterized protein n=1 Tax=Trichonephila clavata TaxID=2740835 RepID=A0A8X6JU51_TRICU|nr:hypothetical protein TNCT_406821 [Trichonephila clavata]